MIEPDILFQPFHDLAGVLQRQDLLCPVFRRIEGKGPGVGKGVEDPSACDIGFDDGPVLLLIQVEACLVPLHEINLKLQAVQRDEGLLLSLSP